MSTGQKLATDIVALIRARVPLIWVVTPEEARVERTLCEAILSLKRYDIRKWDVGQGIVDINDKPAEDGPDAADFGVALNSLRDSQTQAIWIMRDAHEWLDPMTKRRLRNLARTLPAQEVKKTVIIMSPSDKVPPELSDHATVVRWSLPDREEIKGILNSALEILPEEKRAAALSDEERDIAVEAAVGLSADAAATCYAKSLVTQKQRIVPSLISAEKKQVISGKGIEWYEPDPRGLEALGGLEEFKPWLLARKLAYTQEARAYGLPAPKGVFLVGIPGCGKSLAAKATATAFGVPLLRADMGAAQSKWVGESQENIRKVFAIADTIGRCVLWFDEIEKALAGAVNGAADGGVSSDALGTFLQWMQEHKSEVFVMATANDVSRLPPELLRKGRFDELFFVDLPTATERRQILRVTLDQFKKNPGADGFENMGEVIKATEGFTGSEIAAIVPEAMFAAFSRGERESLPIADLVDAARKVVPLSKTMPERIKALREWAATRARPASKIETPVAVSTGARKLDM